MLSCFSWSESKQAKIFRFDTEMTVKALSLFIELISCDPETMLDLA